MAVRVKNKGGLGAQKNPGGGGAIMILLMHIEVVCHDIWIQLLGYSDYTEVSTQMSGQTSSIRLLSITKVAK